MVGITQQDVADLYRRYWPMIRGKCARMLGDSAEAQDVAQETFCRFWARRAELADPQAAAAWLYRTSTHLAVDRLRSKQRAARHDAAQHSASFIPVALSGSPETTVAWRQLLRRTRLTAPQRELEAVLLNRVDGLAQDEIGDVLGISERTVRRLLRRFDQRVNATVHRGRTN